MLCGWPVECLVPESRQRTLGACVERRTSSYCALRRLCGVWHKTACYAASLLCGQHAECRQVPEAGSAPVLKGPA